MLMPTAETYKKYQNLSMESPALAKWAKTMDGQPAVAPISEPGGIESLNSMLETARKL